MRPLIRQATRSTAFAYAAPRIMVATVLMQALGLARQILVAGYFGLTRDLDVYYATLAVATVLVLVFAPMLESLAIPELMRAREASAAELRRLGGALLIGSLALALVLSAALVLAMPLLAAIVSAGFSGAERRAVAEMAPAFLLWTLVALPYAALAAIHKSAKRYNLVLGAELALSVVATLALIAWHARPHDIAWAMGLGYAAAFAWLLVAARAEVRLAVRGAGRALRRIGRNAAELTAASQIASVSSIVDRALQSYLVPGAVAAFATTAQLTSNLGAVLTLRELPIVPLAQREDRARRLERLLIAMCLLSIPAACFLHAVSSDLLALVFRRGRFDETALALMSSVFTIYVFTLVPATANVPVLRMFQIVDAIKYVGILNVVSVAVYAGLGGLAVIALDLGVVGLALTAIVNSALSCVLGLVFLANERVHVRVAALGRHVAVAGLTGAVALALTPLGRVAGAPLTSVVSVALIFAATFAVGYGLIARRIKAVLVGEGPGAADALVGVATPGAGR